MKIDTKNNCKLFDDMLEIAARLTEDSNSKNPMPDKMFKRRDRSVRTLATIHNHKIKNVCRLIKEGGDKEKLLKMIL